MTPARGADEPVGGPQGYAPALPTTVGRYAADELLIAHDGPNGAVATRTIDPRAAGGRGQSDGVTTPEVTSSAGTPDATLLYPLARGRFADASVDRVLSLRSYVSGSNRAYRLAPADTSAAPSTTPELPAAELGRRGATKLRATALAAGDLDLSIDAGEAHDEAAMAIETDDHKVSIVVADYHAKPGSVTFTSLDQALGTTGPDRAVDQPGSVAVGIGDVDGDGRREIVAAYPRMAKGGGEIAVAILRYERDADAGKLSVLSPPTAIPFPGNGPSDDPTPVQAPSLEMAIADFSGRAYDEVAVSSYAAGGGSVRVVVLGYDQRATTAGADVPFTASSVGVTDVSANVPATSEVPGLPGGTSGGRSNVPSDYRPRLVTSYSQPSATQPLSRRGLALAYAERDTVNSVTVVRRGYTPKAALLTVAPAGSSYACGGGVKCNLVVNAGSPIPIGPSTTISEESYHQPSSDQAPVPAISLASGGFAGIAPADQVPPPWDLVASTFAAPAPAPDAGGFGFQPVSALWVIPAFTTGGGNAFFDNPVEIERDRGLANLIPDDRTGRSLFLGPPLLMTLENVDQVDVLAAEPPKQLDFDAAQGRFHNVSRNGLLYVQLQKSEAQEFKTTTVNSGGYTVGGSVEVGGTDTFEAGSKLLGEGAETELEAKLKVGYAFSREEKQQAAVGGSYDTAVEQKTSGADVVGYTARSINVYRYPIYGPITASTDGTVQRFLEVSQPVSKSTAYVGTTGLLGESYQPTWQNGNLFSYPRLLPDGTVDRPDQGSYVPLVPQQRGAQCDKTGVAGVGVPTVAGPETSDQVANITLDVGPAATTKELSYSATASSACDISSTHKATQEAGIKATASVEAGLLFSKISASAYLDVNYEAEESWSNLKTADVSATTASKFTLGQDDALLDEAYPYVIGTTYYFSKSGAQRVVHAVRIPEDKGFKTEYTRPDPALNLPEMMLLNTNDTATKAPTPYWNKFPYRQQIRGFFVVHPDDPSVAAVERGAEFGRTPYAGEPAEIDVRVYNYSLSTDVRDLEVKFEAVPFETDEDGNDTVGAPIDLGREVVPAVCARKANPACPASLGSAVEVLVKHRIDTSKLLPPEHGAQQEYRIFVTLDPDNKIPNETHEQTDRYGNPPRYLDRSRLVDPYTGKADVLESGQNNRGFGLLTVARDADTVTGRSDDDASAESSLRAGEVQLPTELVSTSGPNVVVPTDVSLGDSALTAMVAPGDVRGEGDRIAAGLPSVFRVHLDSDQDSHRYHVVELFDGDPDRGGKLVGRGTARGVTADGGTSASIVWTPTRTGELHLYARVREPGSDLQKGNATTDAAFRVVDPADLGEAGDGGSSAAGPTIAAIVALVVVGGGLVLLRRRSHRSSPPA